MHPNRTGMAMFVLLPFLAVAAALASGQSFDFMPPGGKAILIETLGKGDPAEIAAIASRKADREEWVAWARSHEAGLDDPAIETFAGYAALNFPLDGEKLLAIRTNGLDVPDEDEPVLPPDGKDLATAQCQFCHSLFSSYLMQDRDKVGWESTFKSPFHVELPMTETERATFVSYSVTNMPLKFEDVPPELRF